MEATKIKQNYCQLERRNVDWWTNDNPIWRDLWSFLLARFTTRYKTPKH